MTERVLRSPGGASEAKQDAELTALGLLAREATLDAIGVVLAALSTDSHADLLAILTRLGQTLSISAANLPLPAGAATDAKQLPDNHQVTVSNTSFPLPAAQITALTPPAQISGFSLEATQQAVGLLLAQFRSANHADLEAIRTQLGQTLSISAANLPLPAGARIEAGHGSAYANPDFSRDYFKTQVVLETQTADATGLVTFTFPTPVTLAYIFLTDQQSHSGVYIADGSTPTLGYGIPILPGVPNSIPSETTTVKALVSNGGVVTVWGYRYG